MLGLKETRPNLFEAGVNRGRFGTHGYRRSFVTIHLAAGYSETWCTDRTGHETRTQLDRYRQMARTVKEIDLGELVRLDEAVHELYNSYGNSPGNTPRKHQHEWRNGRRTGFRFPASGDDESQSVGSAEEPP